MSQLTARASGELGTVVPGSVPVAVLAWCLVSGALAGSVLAQTPAPAQGGARGAAPAAPAPAGQAGPAGASTPLPTPIARTFTGAVGLAFNTVRPDRVVEFETLLAEVQQALARSTVPGTQAQAKGWRFFKAAEPGPNGSVMYVFVIDPVAPGEDYSLGKVLVEAFPDVAKLQEVWKLYTGSVTGGGSLLNLTPVAAVAPGGRGRGAAPPALAPAAVAPLVPPAGADALPRMLPPDADPNRR